MKKKKYYKTIQNNKNMGLNDSICKNKVGYCTKKKVFLNGQQISMKMCGCKNLNKKTGEYTPCSYFISKNAKPEKFQEKIDEANALHKKGEEINKKHIKVVTCKNKEGEIIQKEIPLCQTIHLDDKYKEVMENLHTATCECTYSGQFLGKELMEKRGCIKGQFGKIEENECPYLLMLKRKETKKTKAKKKTRKNETNNIIYKDEEVFEKELKEDEVLLFGQVFKKKNIGL